MRRLFRRIARPALNAIETYRRAILFGAGVLAFVANPALATFGGLVVAGLSLVNAMSNTAQELQAA